MFPQVGLGHLISIGGSAVLIGDTELACSLAPSLRRFYELFLEGSTPRIFPLMEHNPFRGSGRGLSSLVLACR